MDLDIVTLDGISLDETTGAPVVSAKDPTTSDEDTENFGNIPMMACLGVSSAPYGKDSTGYCEAVVATGLGGRDAVGLGARDTRTADIVANLKPGDTCVHTTGPNKAAQLQLKEAKKQAVLVTKGSDGKQILLSLDGANDKVTIAAFGMVFDMNNAAGTISLMSKSGSAGLIISDAGVKVVGPILLGSGSIPLIAGNVGTTPPGVPVPGVFV